MLIYEKKKLKWALSSKGREINAIFYYFNALGVDKNFRNCALISTNYKIGDGR